MDYKIERVKAEDYDELLEMMNRAFHKEGERSFLFSLPVMWERDDEHMSKHLAIRDNGKIVAVVGVYPLPTVIAGQPVMFGTIGNVATLPEYTGRGMMKCLMTEAIKEAKKMGMDVARLGGLRQRYNRYGFENAGVDYQFVLTPKNLKDYYSSDLSGEEAFHQELMFRKISLEDTEFLRFVMNLYKTKDMYVDRGGPKQFFKTLSAYKNGIWVALRKDGMPVGYVVASVNGATISEHCAVSPEEEYRMLCEWILFAGVKELTFHTAPWECELNQKMGKLCEKWNLIDTSHFNPFCWSKLLDALLKIKAKYSIIPDGNFILKIEGYGTVEFNKDQCVDTDKTPHMELSHLDAVRFLLGSLPIEAVCDLGGSVDMTVERRMYAQSVFPLPLWWCNQDRV